MARSRLSRLCVMLWLMVLITGILRATDDAFEDATTPGLRAGLAAVALAVSACTVIAASAGRGTLPAAHRVLRVLAVTLWLTEASLLVMRNTGGPHPADYLLGLIFATGLAAATATVCLAIRTAGDHDKARLVRALAAATEQSAPTLQHRLVPASSVSPRAGR